MQFVQQQYQAIEDQNQKLNWNLSVGQQLHQWKERARSAIGMSTSIGLAVGGAAATVAGATAAAATGVVRGIQNVVQGSPSVPPIPSLTPPPPDPDPSMSRPTRLRRSNSDGDLRIVPSDASDICPKCDLGQYHRAHTYRGTCRGFPPSVYFGPRPKAGPRANPVFPEEPRRSIEAPNRQPRPINMEPEQEQGYGLNWPPPSTYGPDGREVFPRALALPSEVAALAKASAVSSMVAPLDAVSSQCSSG